jgi:putative ABC transport system substrate-binding protein
VQVFVVSSGVGTLAAKQATATVPIVFTGVDDPIGDGPCRQPCPAGWQYDRVGHIGPQLSGKRLEVFREALPLPHACGFTLGALQRHSQYARDGDGGPGVRHHPARPCRLRDPSEFDAAFAALTRERLAGLIVQSGLCSSVTGTDRGAGGTESAADDLFPAGVRGRRRASWPMAHSLPDRFRRAATYVDKILKGGQTG